MSRQPQIVAAQAGKNVCLARSVAAAFAENAKLEAVTINRDRETISIATMGHARFPELQESIARTFRHAQSASDRKNCTLMAGEGQCVHCLWPLSEEERKRITIRHDSNKTTIERVTCPTAPLFWRWRDIPLPKVAPRKIGLPKDEHESAEWKLQLVASLLCAAFGLAGYFLGEHPLAAAAFLTAYTAGAWFAARDVIERLHQSVIDVHFLMLAVAAGSAAIGAWGEGVTLLFLFSLSGAMEHFAFARTQEEIRSLFRDAPKTATVLDDSGHETEMEVSKLVPGMRLLLKPGAQFPVDAQITRGQTASDESNLTGEAIPVEKRKGDIVFSGTMNLWGAVEAVALRSADKSSLQKIIHMIKEAQQRKAPSQSFTDRFSTCYTYTALAVSLLMFFVWWLGSGIPAFAHHEDVSSAFYRTMTLLVVASPCALVLSIPSAVLAAIAWGARHGVLFRGGAAVEKLAAVTTVALDKTGTLTTGELRVETVESFPDGHERQIAELACSLERLSTHPLARAITRYGKQQGFTGFEVQEFESVTGQGLRGRVDGEECLIGRRDWLASAAPNFNRTAVPDLDHDPAINPTSLSHGLSELWVSKGLLLGRLILRDEVRPESRKVIRDLESEGLRTVVLTGDRQASAEHLRLGLGIHDIRFGLKPEEKLEAIGEMTRAGQKVAMIGDGVNDAPSLAAAHIGVAMGARGADVALEQADIVLMHDRLENFLAAFRLSQRARRVIRQNLVVSLGTVLLLVTFAMLGRIPLTVAVVGHEGSTVLVVMNSLRLLFHGGARPDPPGNRPEMK